MKTITTLIFVIVLGAFALANPNDSHVKSSPLKVDLVLDACPLGIIDFETIEITTDKEVARLYRRKNSLVKKALNFSTKRTKAKLA